VDRIDLHKENKVVRVRFAGGLIGLLAGSPFLRIEKCISVANKDGWNLATVIPDSTNLVVFVLRAILLVLTLGLWTLATGYIIVFERPRSGDRKQEANTVPGGQRIEPPVMSRS